MIIYVGNISYEMEDHDLIQVFSEFGEVSSAKVVKYKKSGRSKGYGFVEMPNETEALGAVEAMDKKEIFGRLIKVSAAHSTEYVEGQETEKQE
jgi:RNA recognition motif-containing protein